METRHLIWTGVGEATFPFFEFSDFDKVTLVDARACALESLKLKLNKNENIEYIQSVVAVTEGEEKFFSVKPELQSQLGDITKLKELYPNLTVVEETKVFTTTLANLLSETSAESEKLTIVLDLPYLDESLIKQVLRHNSPLNITSVYVLDGNKELLENAKYGFTFVGRIKGGFDGDYAHFFRDSKVSILEKGLSDFQKSSEQRIKQLETELEYSRQELSKNLVSGIASQQSELSIISNQLQKISDAVQPATIEKRIHNTLTGFQQRFESILSDTSAALTSEVKGLSDRQQTLIENLQSEEFSRVIRNIPFLLQKNSYNTSKQIESFISLNQYINHHEKPMSFHGWPISPDIGLTLIDFIENKNVDTVIEFGSGTSSVLFAKTFKLANPNNANWCLEQPITSFEHNEEYLKKTSQLLTSHQCRDFVNLTHAPLVEFEYSGPDQFHYYDCEETIANLSASLGNDKKCVLVLIDGPPGVTNKNARFPALPILLKHMSIHRLIIVMDDFARDDEQETFKLWEAIVAKSGLSYKSQTIETEKGLSILTIN